MKTTIFAILLLSALNLGWYYIYEQRQNESINFVYNEHIRLVNALKGNQPRQAPVQPTPKK